ncbi:alpha-amylase family glycosyl hydrolase [Micropruina sonneratiae]|uniref:pullulanase X25 domain-containing protein n=1 Tax=Micropruina sonneratiae TaxID=2986940 RepID=UPI002227D8AF|nr:alpha-amylase family glycosyl hydrolase [Micropruina sp. KQZ13P-5]MCW3157007.1 alpha-amylase family glycosyl hydrolase [Micropruina sp. KQZ13P-5]
MQRRRSVTALIVLALLLGWLTAATPARAEERTVTLVGDLQSELGCSDDWQPVCTATDLAKGRGSNYAAEFTVPAGRYELKVAINHSWDESYGAEGGSANIPLALSAAAKLRFSYDDSTHLTTIKPVDLPGSTTTSDRKLAVGSLRESLTRERFYFLMADRFANGSKANDTGGLTGGRLTTGYDPTDSGFYHGGDLKGVTKKLDYIKGLGTTAIWLTPSFKNNPVQGSGDDVSAGYHGYWITDFTRIDPHLGSNDDMKQLIAKAHAKGMKVFFDIITNHTADIIDYTDPTAGGSPPYTYISKADAPYKTASGQAFDDRDYVNSEFPALDAATSFPYTPTFRTTADETVKVPQWLNDPTLYHNRGNSTFAGESSTYGDFVGLDDLFTENPEVVQGMEEIYSTWADFGIDGFRIDTVKHVNTEFWQQFAPTVLDHARASGNDDFFMFGEVYDSSPTFTSQYTTTGKLQATLDFGFQNAVTGFAQGKATTGLRDLYAGDDWYTDADSNAYQLPTFTGNHDMGRQAMMLRQAGFSAKETLTRLKLANSLMYLTRGQPVVYYGDEQGFAGSGGDKAARQDMFASKVASYNSEEVIGGASGSKNRYNTDSTLYRQIAKLARIRAQHPALADGAQIARYSSDTAGIFAVSRIDTSAQREYLVVSNNATTAKKATFSTYSANTRFDELLGSGGDVSADRFGRVSVTVPALSVRVFRAASRMPASSAAPVIVPLFKAGGTVGGRAELAVALADTSRFAEVSFYSRPAGTTQWQLLGTDDNPRYRVYQDVSALPTGTLLEYRIVARDLAGRYSATSSYAFVGEPSAGASTITNDPPEKQPDAVSVPGSFNAAIGCADDWDPACDQAQLALDDQSKIWATTLDVPKGDYAYKAAIDKNWDENYGAGGVRNGSNINLKPEGGAVSFYYDPASHWVTSTAEGPILTAPGSFQSELGCSSDWKPDCLRPWLQDADGDGTYAWASTKIPAGSYEFKVAHGLGWDEAYPSGNVSLTVPADGMLVTITYTLATHQVATSVTQATSTPDLSVAKAVLLRDDLIAYPGDGLPLGVDQRALSWRLHWSAKGGLAIDADAVTGGRVATLTRDWKGLPAGILATRPELRGYVALRPDATTAGRMKQIMAGQVAVGLYDDQGRLLDATGVKRG